MMTIKRRFNNLKILKYWTCIEMQVFFCNILLFNHGVTRSSIVKDSVILRVTSWLMGFYGGLNKFIFLISSPGNKTCLLNY